MDIDLEALISKTLNGIEAQVALKKIKLERPPNGLKSKVKGDANILGFALRNVLSNAFKFSSVGSKVIINCEQIDGKMVLSVTDEGEGIKAETLNILQNNHSISSEGTNEERGTGMGLALSREFLAAMDAKIEIESVIGQGTIVRIILPV